MATIINADTSNGLKLTSDTSGEIELQSAGVTQAKITSSGLQNASGGVISAQSGKNLIINGDMMIDQRNAGASVTITSNAQYTIDRFQGQMSQASKYSVQQVTDTPAKFYNSLKATSLSAHTVLATDFFAIEQRVEGYNAAHLNWGTSDAQTVTMSFWVKSSLTGTFTASLKNGTNTRSFPFTYTIDSANTWEYKTITIPGDTSGTWDKTNGNSIRINFPLGTGTNFTSGTDSGSTGAWQAGNYAGVNGAVKVVSTNAATWQITGFQLEVGTTATPFENLQYTTQLQLCQRYFFRWTDLHIVCPMAAYSTTAIYGPFVYPTTMRAAPTWSVSSASHLTLYMSGTTVATAFATATITENSARLSVTPTTARTQGQAGWLRVNPGSGKYIQAEAEL